MLISNERPLLLPSSTDSRYGRWKLRQPRCLQYQLSMEVMQLPSSCSPPVPRMHGTRTSNRSISRCRCRCMQTSVRVDARTPGPTITISGELSLGGFTADLIFKNNVKGTHTAVEVGRQTAILLQWGTAIELPKQPVLGGVGGTHTSGWSFWMTRTMQFRPNFISAAACRDFRSTRRFSSMSSRTPISTVRDAQIGVARL